MVQPIRILFREDLYDGQFARTLSASYAGMADLGEAFATAHAVGRPTPNRWFEAWDRLAASTMTQLDTAEASPARDRESARSLALRASEYARQAGFFLRHNLADPRLHATYRRQVDAFARAFPHLAAYAEASRIPYEGTWLKAFFYSADHQPIPRPTILFPCGYDSTAEEGWTNVPAALARGFNAVCFEGPGQGEALYDQGLVFRPDFDAVVTPLIDLLETHPRVDRTAVVLVGRSFAGYLAPQAATVEHRIAALVCDPAQPYMGAHLPKGLIGKVAAPAAKAEMRFSHDKEEFFGARMAAHGVTTVEDYFAELRRYTMLANAADIACPTLIVECEGDPIGGGGPALAAAIGDRATLRRLTIADGAGGHCGWMGQRVWEDLVFGWLDTIITRRA